MDTIVATVSKQQRAANANEFIRRVDTSMDSLQRASDNVFSRVQSVMDSVRSDANRMTQVSRSYVDSVLQWRDRQLYALRSAADSLKLKVQERMGTFDIPEVSKLGERFGQLESKLSLGLETNSFSAPNLDIPVDMQGSMNALKQNVPSLSGGELGLKNEIPSVGVLEGDLTKDVSQLGTGEIERVSESTGLTAVQDEVVKGTELQGSLASMAGEDGAREMLEAKVTQQAVDHFAGKQAEIESAMQTLSKYKKKFDSATDIKQLPKRQPNPMRDVPFGKRLLPGVSFQINHKDSWLIDINPYVGYWINGRIVAGLGWNYRIAYSSSTGFGGKESINGPRTYGEYAIAKGFSARVEAELMKVFVPAQFSSGRVDAQGREWVFGTMIGVKKSYRIIKRMNGTAMALYNVYNPDDRSPYQNRLVLRIGVEIQERRTKTKKSHPG